MKKMKMAAIVFLTFALIQTTLLIKCKAQGMHVDFFAFFVFVLPALFGALAARLLMYKH